MLKTKSILFLLLLFSCGTDEDASLSLDPISDNIVSPDYKSNFRCSNCGENLNSFNLEWNEYTSLENNFTSYEVLFGDQSQSIASNATNYFFASSDLRPSTIIDNAIYILTMDDGSSIKDTITAFTQTLSPATWPEENAIKTSLNENGESTNTINWIDSNESGTETKIYRLSTQDASFTPEINVLEELSGWTELSISSDGTSILDTKESSNDIHFYILKTSLADNIRYSTIKRDINLTSSFQYFPNFSASNNRYSKIILEWEAYTQNDFYSYEIWECDDESCDESSASHVITIIDKSISSFIYNTFDKRGKTVFFKLLVKNIFDYEKSYTASGVSL